jgi:hypothetical protein
MGAGSVVGSWHEPMAENCGVIDRKTGQPLRDNQERLNCKQLHGNDDPMREAKRLLKEYDAAIAENQISTNHSFIQIQE